MVNALKMPFILAVFIVILGCCSQPSQSLRILAIFPLNGKSHHIFCEGIAKGLAVKGHQVDVYSHFPAKKVIPNYRDFSLADTLPAHKNNMSVKGATTFQMSNIGKLLEVIGSPICELMGLPIFQELFKKTRKDKIYDIVIIEPFMSNCFYAWGRYLNVPMVTLVASQLFDWQHEPFGNPHYTAVTPGMGATNFHPMTFWQRLLSTLMCKIISISYNNAVLEQDKYVEKYFGTGYPNSVDLQKEVDLVLVNSHHSLDGMKAFTPGVIPVAGVHISEDDPDLPKDVQKWLDDSKDGCIYFTLGSMLRIETLPKDIIVNTLYASFKNIAPVRVLMKIPKPDELPSGLPANVMTQTWFTQLRVLQHKNTKGFITHGGMMSSLESIQSAVPMVGIPVFGDQPTNVQSNVKKGIAIALDLNSLSEKKVTHALRELLYNPKYKKNIDELAIKFLDRPSKPLDTAIFWIEYIARHGKGALRSPLVDMPWWQANLLDVYAFILGALIIVLYIVKKVLNLVCMLLGCAKKEKNEPNITKKKQ